MTPAESGVLLDALAAAFPRATMSPETVQLYAIMLVDIDFDAGIATVARWCASERKFPLIAELREAIARERGDGPPPADRAFAELRAKLGSVGRYGEPAWSHPAIGVAATALGTWWDLCDTKVDDLAAMRAHFARAYEAAAHRAADPGLEAMVKRIASEVRQRLAGGVGPRELAPGVGPGSRHPGASSSALKGGD